MALSLPVPFVGKEFLDFRIMEWLVAEGDEIRPGDDICQLRAISRQRVSRAAKPSRFRRKAEPEASEMKIRHHPPLISVTAGEQGTIESLVVPVDGVVRQGAEIATISTAADGEQTGQFLAVANMTGIDHEGAG